MRDLPQTAANSSSIHGWTPSRVATPCPVCKSYFAYHLFTSTDRLYHTTRDPFQILECAECRLIRLSPWPDPSHLHHFYPQHYWFEPQRTLGGQFSELYRRLVLQDHVRFVRRALDRSEAPGMVVDVGCGGGLFLRMLAPRRRKVVGVDFSIEAAAVAWSTNRIPVLNCSFSQPPFAPGSCAAITMFHVLEHLYTPEEFLKSAHRLLHPQGRLIIQVPNAASWQFLLFGKAWNGIDVPRHLINFKDSDIELLLDRCGFEIVRRKYFSLRDNPAGFATSLVPALDPMARRLLKSDSSPAASLAKDLLYFALVAAAVPLTALEAACRAGSTFMVEARKKR